MPFNIGPAELIIVLIIALIVVGPGKLPDLGAAVGKSLKPFVETLERNSGNIESTIKDARDLASKLSTAANKVEGVLASAENLFSGQGVRGMVGDVGDAARSIRKLADNLDARTKEITAGLNRATGPALRQYEQLAADAQVVGDHADELVERHRRRAEQPQRLAGVRSADRPRAECAERGFVR